MFALTEFVGVKNSFPALVIRPNTDTKYKYVISTAPLTPIVTSGALTTASSHKRLQKETFSGAFYISSYPIVSEDLMLETSKQKVLRTRMLFHRTSVSFEELRIVGC